MWFDKKERKKDVYLKYSKRPKLKHTVMAAIKNLILLLFVLAMVKPPTCETTMHKSIIHKWPGSPHQ
jgi:hypothetical protein